MSEELNRKRGGVKAKLTIFKNYLKEFDAREKTQDSFIELDLRTSQAENILSLFDDVQSVIELNADDPDPHYLERADFEAEYYFTISFAKKLLNKYNGDKFNVGQDVLSVHSYPQAFHEKPTIGVKLPIIDLPKFDGDYDHWLEFKDTFESLIHNNSLVNDIQKFHYLRASLKENAAEVIQSLEFSASNYQVAWELLCKRYENNRMLIYNHVKALFDLEPIETESSIKIRKIVDSVSKHLRSLNSLKQPTDQWDTLIIYLITTKLDNVTAREWEQSRDITDVPSLKKLMTFLKSRAEILEALQLNKQSSTTITTTKYDKKYNSPNTNINTNINRTHKSFPTTKQRCTYCKKDHYIQFCEDFLRLKINDRIESVNKLKICNNCLRPGHFTKYCRSVGCKHCNMKHNSLLHIGTNNVNSNTTNETTVNSNKTNQTTSSGKESSIALSCYSQKHVLLSTATITIFDKNNKSHTIRVLLDGGSQSSFINDSICNQLQLVTTKIAMTVGGINNATTTITNMCNVRIKSNFNSFEANISCLVLPEITGELPNFKVDLSKVEVPSNIELADPSFHTPGSIDMLIGADWFWDLLCIGQIKLNIPGPILQKTKLGWIISGPINTSSCYYQKVQCHISENKNLEDQLKKFWQIEEISIDKPLSKDEQLCETIFISTTCRDENGRFIVHLPLKKDVQELGDSRKIAEKRFLSLERKLNYNAKFKEMYVQFMNEYLDLGHMEKVTDDNMSVSYYMPHHGVFREASVTTKLRVVFDASASTSSGNSLNDLQYTGPTIQQDLLSILLRFRKYNYVFCGDIEKMYRQILISPEQRSLQKIFWREKADEPIDTFLLKTVTYGTRSAPFLAIRSLYQLGIDCAEDSPEVSRVIKNDFYVDDLISGADTIEQAITIANKTAKVLKGGCFNLRKWISNDARILQSIFGSSNDSNIIDFAIDGNVKTLGLFWSCQSDYFQFKISKPNNQGKITKRTILSSVAQIFDPLGLLSPCIVTAKIMLQKLWLLKLSWNESLPADIHTKWSAFRGQLDYLNEITIPRQVTIKNARLLQIHGFSDASENAYGACVYIRSENSDGTVSVRLLCSKSKVAPLKSVTIPRLELCGALTLANLMNKVKCALNVEFERTFCWCDSTIVLGWIKISPSSLETFVSNRVSQIQDLTNFEDWRHVPTQDNPADHLSRGVNPRALISLDQWWVGPSWLRKNDSEWPILKTINNIELPEVKKYMKNFNLIKSEDFIGIQNYSNLNKLQRIMAYCLRFKENCLLSKNDRILGPLTSFELKQSLLVLVKISQQKSFNIEIKALNQNLNIDKSSKLFSLNPLLDKNGILRVGGRLENSNFNYNKRHPVILCPKDHFTIILFRQEHRRLLHAGPQLLLANIRETFWPLLGRNLARKTVHECVRCFKVKPTISTPIMGNLPKNRVQIAPVFSTTGVDYMGPFLLKDKKGRGCKIIKAYVSLFICFVTKAIHMEVVSDLTTEAFIAALRRFVSRRGKPISIYSDNGTNFLGASSKLKELASFLKHNYLTLQEWLENECIEWHFIPANAPHFGGLWEEGVKSAKHHLVRMAGNAFFTFEEFYTLIVQIEAVLNSRPISPLSSDPQDLLPLTPGHFLIGAPLTAIPDEDLQGVPENRLRSMFRRIQQIYQQFWKRWSKEYMNELQQRKKWKASEKQYKLEEGCLVLIKDDNLPPMKWRMGRIESVHLGADGIARVATIMTKNGSMKRAFSKICAFPQDC